MAIGRYVVPVEVLTKSPDLTVDILRLGAFANALNALASMSATSRSGGVGRDRDTLQTVLMVVSYLKESIDTLASKPQLWTLIEAAVAQGFTLRLTVAEYRKLFSRSDGSLYKTLLIDLRRKKGFHVDRDHFQQWVQSVQAPEITIWQRDGDSPLDWAFTISLQIQSFYGQRLEGGPEILRQLARAHDLVFLVEALCAGLMIEAGVDYRKGWRPAGFLTVRVEYTFRDGRPPMTEHRVVLAESLDTLTGTSVYELRVRVAQVFGVLSQWNKTGYVLYPADGGIVMYSTPRGTARVFAEGPAKQQPTGLPLEAEIITRLRGASSWGGQQAQAALKLAEKVRDGAATSQDAAEVLTLLTDSLDYWNNLQRFSDQASKVTEG